MNFETELSPANTTLYAPLAETSLLGICLYRSGTFAQVTTLVRSVDFTTDRYKALWRAMVKAAQGGIDPTLDVLVAGGLLPDELADEAEKLAYGAPHHNAEDYAREIAEAGARRRGFVEIGDIVGMIGNRDVAVAQIVKAIDDARARLVGIIDTPVVLIGPDERTAQALKILQDGQGGKSKAIPFGLPDLDNATAGGMYPGQSIVVAARTGVGKSAFLRHVARSAARTRPVLFASVEMTEEQLIQRDIARQSKVALPDIIRGKLGSDDLAAATDAAETLGQIPIFDYVSGTMTTDQLRRVATEFHARTPLAVVIVDYLQILRDEGKHGNVERVTRISGALKALAMDLNVPVVVASQVNRDSAKEDRAPELYDIRESGAIEQDADVVLMLHPKSPKEIDLIVKKQRQGIRDHTITLDWYGSSVLFANKERQW